VTASQVEVIGALDGGPQHNCSLLLLYQ